MRSSLYFKFYVILLIALPIAALAQDPAAVDPVNLLAQGVKTLAESAQSKNWALFIPTLIVLLVTAVRWLGSKLAAEGTLFRKFLSNKWTKWGMNFATAFCGALVGAATAKMPVTANLIINALMMAFAAAGGVEFFRDVVDSVSKDKATTAGNAAAKDPGSTLNS